jgi:hypothetical protein
MPEAPKPVALILCDRIEVNVATAQMSLVGIFHHRRFRSFPTAAQRFTAYVALHGGEGEGRISLDIARANTEATIYTYQRWTGFPDPDLITTFEAPVRRCAFPEPGRYIVTLRFDGEILADRVLDIFQE